MPSYETLIYEQDDHVVTLTYNRPDQHNAISRTMNDGAPPRLAALPRRRRGLRARDHGRGRDDLLGRLGPRRTPPSSTSSATGTSSASHLYNSPGRVRLHPPRGRLQAGDRGGQRLRVRRRARDRAARGHPDRRRERRVRRARAPLEHRRRRRHDGSPAARRRVRPRDGADHHGAADRRRARPSGSGSSNEVVPRGKALERAQELAHEIAALPQGAIRSDKESVIRGVGRTYEERLRIEAELTMSMFMRRDSHTIGAGAFKRGRASPSGRTTGCSRPLTAGQETAAPAARPAAERWTGSGYCGSSRRARPSAGRPSIIGLRSSNESSTRRVEPIWKSAAFGSSSRSRPRRSGRRRGPACPGARARRARTRSSSRRSCREQARERHVRACLQTGRGHRESSRAAGVAAGRGVPGPSGTSGAGPAAGRARPRPPPPRPRAALSAGNSGGSGRSPSSAREIRSDPWMRRPSIRSAGTVPPRKPASRRSTGCSPG